MKINSTFPISKANKLRFYQEKTVINPRGLLFFYSRKGYILRSQNPNYENFIYIYIYIKDKGDNGVRKLNYLEIIILYCNKILNRFDQ